MLDKHFLIVVSPGPLMILRVPWPMLRWRSILRATTPVMQSHGFRQKDISSLEGIDQTDTAFVSRLHEGYAGVADRVPRFWLYDWDNGSFQVVRSPLEAS